MTRSWLLCDTQWVYSNSEINIFISSTSAHVQGYLWSRQDKGVADCTIWAIFISTWKFITVETNWQEFCCEFFTSKIFWGIFMVGLQKFCIHSKLPYIYSCKHVITYLHKKIIVEMFDWVYMSSGWSLFWVFIALPALISLNIWSHPLNYSQIKSECCKISSQIHIKKPQNNGPNKL